MAYNSKTIWYSTFLILLSNWGNLGKSTAREYKALQSRQTGLKSWHRCFWARALCPMLHSRAALCHALCKLCNLEHEAGICRVAAVGTECVNLCKPFDTHRGRTTLFVCFPIFFFWGLFFTQFIQKIMIMYYVNRRIFLPFHFLQLPFYTRK